MTARALYEARTSAMRRAMRMWAPIILSVTDVWSRSQPARKSSSSEAASTCPREMRRSSGPADFSAPSCWRLCHGAAGLGHLFNRMFQATGQQCLAEASRFWFERAIGMRRPGRGIGGYEAWAIRDDGEMTWQADQGLLVGAAGIALAMMAATSDVEPAWDRMLLVDVPPRAAVVAR